MNKEKEQIFKGVFTKVIDKGQYISCIMGGKKRVWMYSKKLIEELSPEKLKKLVENQV